MLLLFFSYLRREDQCVVFSPRYARAHAVVINDPFWIYRFFGSEKSTCSEITNPFLDSPKKTHPRPIVVAFPT